MVYGQDEEDPAFIETLNRRVAEIESGKVKGIPVEETFEKINRELTHQTAAFFYAERDPELAFDFNKRIRQAEEQIAEHPERYPFFAGAHLVRKSRRHWFPFSILYIDHANYIWVVAMCNRNHPYIVWPIDMENRERKVP